MENLDEEKSSYGGFERFLFFITPVLFTLILLGVLLTLFNYDFKNSLLSFADKIPLVNRLIPDSETTPGRSEPVSKEPSKTELSKQQPPAQKVQELEQQLTIKNAEMLKMNETPLQKEEKIKSLEQKVANLQNQSTAKYQSQEDYQKQIEELAGVYANMSPSKAAPILENLTLEEQTLILSKMKTDERTRVLEKMDPKKAAEASIHLKDITKVNDREIAALQSRLNLNAQSTIPSSAKALTKDDIGQTFAAMQPKSAAELLLQMYKSTKDQAKVLSILSSMDTAARSRILSSMADASKEDAAKITARLSK